MAFASLIRVLLVEDNPLVRQTLKSVLQQYSNIELIGEADNGEEVVLKAGQLQPTVVVMDINLPKLDGVAATRLIKANYPHIAIVGLTVNTQAYNLDAMLKAGAFETVSKEKAFEELYGVIQRAVASIQPILVLDDSPASAKAPAELGESAPQKPMNGSQVQESKEVTESGSGSES
jgi:DNA-binding NarL/FixJ family response regulator